MINNKPSSEQTSWQDRLSCHLFSLLYTTAIVEAVVQYTLQRFPEEASLRECLLRIEQLFWNSWLSLPPFWSFARPPKQSQKTLWVKFVPRFPIVSGVGNCKTFNVFPKFLCFQLPNISGHDILAIRKRLLRSAITRRTREYKKLLLVKKQLLSDVSNIFNSLDF